MPVAPAPRTTKLPRVAVSAVGWKVNAGAAAAALTVSRATGLVTEPEALRATTE